MDRVEARAAPRERTAVSGQSSSRCSRYCVWIVRIDRDTVFVELCDGQSQRIDELVLRINAGLIADLLWVQVVGDAEQPMLRARFVGILCRVKAINRHQ